MPISIAGLRKWFALMALGLVAIVACFYLYAQWQQRHEVHERPKPLGISIQQSTEGFHLSKSQGGRTLFSVRAANAVQFKSGGRATLHDVNIIVYGKQANRFDQIYGKEFEYDPQSGNITGIGAVHMELESNAQGPAGPDQAPPEAVQNPIRIDTTGLTFNQKTGDAATPSYVHFTTVQASGSAVGATYTSKTNSLVLGSNVNVTTNGPEPSNIIASHAIVTKVPRQIVLDKAVLVRPQQTISADKATIFLDQNNVANRIVAVGNVRGQTQSGVRMQSAQADFKLLPHNMFRSGVLTGGVAVQQPGPHPMDAVARTVDMDFADGNQVSKMHAVDHVRMIQHQAGGPGQVQQVQLDSYIVDFFFKSGQQLDHADTSGPAQILVVTSPPAPKPAAPGAKPRPPAGPTRTTVTARKFHAAFGDDNQITAVHGAPDGKIVSLNPGQPDRVSTSRAVDATFASDGTISKIVQTDDVHYIEGQREGWSQKATYTPADTVLLLNGSPRVVEKNMTTTADVIRLNRQSGEAFAQGNVKSTYSDLKQQPDGAMLASSDPIHVTSASMTANRNSNLAVYTGGARLWQGGNVVRGSTITFNRVSRSMLAQAEPNQQVSTVFLQTSPTGAASLVYVTSTRLTYSDLSRQAHFEGGVVMKSSDGTTTADDAVAYLLPRGQRPATRQPAAADPDQPSQLDHIVADGHVVIQQPTRRGTGNHLVYTAVQGKYVLTGGSPSIFDAEKGNVRGDSLTFYNRDDTVLVESKASSPTVTQTRVAK